MDDLLNFETSFTGENDSDDDLLTSDNENDRTAPSSNIPPTAPQHQKPVSGHDSYSSGADILTSSPDAPPPAQRFSFLSEKKASKTRTNSLYQDAQKRQEKLEKLRQKKFEDEYGKGNFQPNLTSSAKKRSKSVAALTAEMNSSTSTSATDDKAPKATNAAFDRMYSRSKTMDHKKRERVKQLQEEEAQDCTFKPKIYSSPGRKSSISGGVVETIRTGSVFDRQFEYSKAIEKKKEELAKSIQERECTFKPDIARTSPTKSTGPITTRKSSVEATVKRLYDPEKFKLAEIERLKRQKELELSEATFAPNVNKDINITGGTTTTTTTSTTSSAPPSESGEGDAPPATTKGTEACLRLYQKASVEGSKREKWIEEQKQKKVDEQCGVGAKAFSPNVSASARKAKSGRSSLTGSEKSVFERLQRNDFKVFHVEKDENLTFKPKILEKKIKDGEGELAKLVAMPLNERFDRLYKEGKERVEKKNMLPKDEQAAVRRRQEQEELRECTFKPKTTWKAVFGMNAFEDDDSYNYGNESSFMDNGEGGFEFVDNRGDFVDDDFDEVIGQGEDEVLGTVDQANVQAQEALGELGEVNDILGEMTIDNESMGVQHHVEALQVQRQDSEGSVDDDDDESEHNIWEGHHDQDHDLETYDVDIDVNHTEFDTDFDSTPVSVSLPPNPAKEIEPVIEPPKPPATDEEVHD
eukprot:CAMPEP_0182508234 /NCGR_PEP_ID=MMETSP1321-20130603/24616_1 /TAXON_ID=91990 /ORGANISM="Bolidomonas sp., Strain RCC1657" /LENGTH=695 /DNA_ID=CAMNT_0024714277 /DNA_START=22 /DNA_END=2106 /DNA_ORIENTATION=+